MSTIQDLPLWVARRRSEMVQDLADYVSQETPSDHKPMLAAGLSWIEEWLQSRIGTPAKRRLVDGGEWGDTLVLDYPADGFSDTWVTALCHYDTVWPAGTLQAWTPTVEGDRFSGPGAFDMKGGLVQLVWALKASKDLGLPRPNLRLVLNGDEELGSPASREVIEEESLRGDAVLVFEASAGGALKTARKGVGIFQITVNGQEAHAGLDPEAGASAIDEIARVILHLHGATDLSKGTTVNVGLVRGGTRTNVTAGSATAEFDVRVSSEAEVQRISAVLDKLSPRHEDATLDVSGEWNRPVMARTRQTARLFAQAESVAEQLGFQLSETSVGGASDGNFAAALGLPVLDGLGAVGDGAHARNEWISIDGMLERTCLAAGLLASLDESAGWQGKADLNQYRGVS
ncbi:M20 family metallopeptidase [Arthrobacter sp. M4]|uniref:M20 family metallopeptidase n=1 Tax=Arthrobacter sp. M4 TaxID=218160 RepID=UPI001CDC789E|nr:M20 family metallopeptidase [Arthrobacter sp. M4]MCA4135232.1 M20 family metallopeptidase [Arthrobacter sp. M4]